MYHLEIFTAVRIYLQKNKGFVSLLPIRVSETLLSTDWARLQNVLSYET